MNKSIIRWELLSAAVIIALGFVFHFAFSWLHEWKPSALFFAVNESVWEHLKIGFWPALLVSVLEYLFIRDKSNNFLTAKAAQLLIIPVAIIDLFYTYTGIIGYNVFAADISIFIIAVILGQYVSYRFLTAEPLPAYFSYISLGIIILLIISFSILTFHPIHLPLFQDSRSGIYGIPTP